MRGDEFSGLEECRAHLSHKNALTTSLGTRGHIRYARFSIIQKLSPSLRKSEPRARIRFRGS